MAKEKKIKSDKTAVLWEKLGKTSVDIELTKARLAQLQQSYQEIYQSIQAIKIKPDKPLPVEPKT